MQTLTEIHINNYRSCKTASLPLDDFTPLVGYNNGGKSNILSAIKWLLKPSALSPSDFNDVDCPIVVSGTITGITDQILERLAQRHKTAILPYCTEGSIRIRRSQDSPGGGQNAVKSLVRDPQVEDEDSEDAWRSFPVGIPNALTAMFPAPIQVEAMQNVSDDIAKAKSGSTISDLIKEIVKPITEAHGTELQAALDRIGKRLTADGGERAQELHDFDRDANDKLRELFPGLTIRLHVPPPTLSDLFKTGTIKAKEDGFDWQEFSRLGHGAQRSIQMALIRHLAEIKSIAETGPSRTLLLIDEPELYLHPQGIEQVRAALRTLARTGYQVVFSTHSPLLIHQDEIANTVIVRKNEAAGTNTLKPLRTAIAQVVADGPSQTRTLFEFGNAAQIFFCDEVLIAEGTTERALLPDIFKALKQKTLGQSRIALVGIAGSGGIPKSLRILDALKLTAKALADLDFAFKVAPQARLLEPEDSDVANAKTVFQNLATGLEIDIGNDGFPTNKGAVTASEAFAEFAKHPDGKPIVDSLHGKLLAHRIWLWKNGAIEHHLGVESKTEAGWASYRARLHSEKPEDVIEDVDSINEFLGWLTT